MDTDFSKLFLFIVLALVVLVLVSDKRRPLSSAPLDPSTPTNESQSPDNLDDGAITRGAGWAGVPNYGKCPPLALQSPRTGVQPLEPL